MLQASFPARLVTWSLLFLALLANIAGYVFDLYARWAWFDKVLHPSTIGAITLGLGLALYGRALTGAIAHRVLLIVAIAALGVAVGALWEVAEWAYDQITPGNAIKGKFDTITDLIVDTIGAIVAGIAATHMADEEASGTPELDPG